MRDVKWWQSTYSSSFRKGEWRNTIPGTCPLRRETASGRPRESRDVEKQKPRGSANQNCVTRDGSLAKMRSCESTCRAAAYLNPTLQTTGAAISSQAQDG